jgi:CHAD domain-containing protein
MRPSRLARRLNHFSRRIIKAVRKFEQTPSPENLHRLRKRVKDHQYQLRYWLPRPGAHAARQRRLKRAGQDLGLAHDLWQLRDDLASGQSGPLARQRLAVIEVLARRRGERALRRLRHG